MERLTVKGCKFLVPAIASKNELLNEIERHQKYYDKLARYEDLGLDPEQIKQIDNLYLEKCQEVTELRKEIASLSRDSNAADKTQNIYYAMEHCSEDNCNEECYCYMEDDCKINHLRNNRIKDLEFAYNGLKSINRRLEKTNQEYADRLLEYGGFYEVEKLKKAKAEGRLIELPCELKLKQKWYYIGFDKPIEFEIVDFDWWNTDGLGAYGCGCFPNTSKLFFPFTYWNEYVFKTKEEAEAKLKEREEQGSIDD